LSGLEGGCQIWRGATDCRNRPCRNGSGGRLFGRLDGAGPTAGSVPKFELCASKPKWCEKWPKTRTFSTSDKLHNLIISVYIITLYVICSVAFFCGSTTEVIIPQMDIWKLVAVFLRFLETLDLAQKNRGRFGINAGAVGS
jgi:hypothetical protein